MVVVAASVSVTDEVHLTPTTHSRASVDVQVSASRRMLAQDLDQAGELHDFLKVHLF